MKDWRRMCETIQSQNQQKSNSGWCSGCPLQWDCVIDTGIKDYTDNAFAIIEKRIRSWAAEHPEPVYPTWLEFVKAYETGKPKSDPDFIYWMGTSSIPADLAQKLGIEPKEGV
jgi:hypothetical protein